MKREEFINNVKFRTVEFKYEYWKMKLDCNDNPYIVNKINVTVGWVTAIKEDGFELTTKNIGQLGKTWVPFNSLVVIPRKK